MTEELKKALEEAVTDEQKKAVAEKFKEEISKLSEEELDKVAGGFDWFNPIAKDFCRQLDKAKKNQ